jgi:hypothetical protein
MVRKKGKAVSFDAMVKFFLQSYQIPTKKDVENLMGRLDRLETLIKTTAAPVAAKRAARKPALKPKAGDGGKSQSSSALVLEIIQKARQGVGFAEIQSQTGFEDKKLRNIIFRLHKIGQIKRLNRGTYTAA